MMEQGEADSCPIESFEQVLEAVRTAAELPDKLNAAEAKRVLRARRREGTHVATLAGRMRQDSDAPLLNRRADQYVGRTFTLTEPIENGYGTVRVGDSRWRVSGPAHPAGGTVRVVAVDGATFVVEAAAPE